MAKAKGSANDTSEKEALQALDKIDRAVAKFQAAPTAAAAIDIKQLCKIYNQIKPFLQKVLPLIEKIPVVGKKIATAIKFLMQIADVVCAI